MEQTTRRQSVNFLGFLRSQLSGLQGFPPEAQEENLAKIQENVAPVGIQFTWEYVDAKTIHARHITTDTGWKILLDRGLDIFQRYEMNDAFSLGNRVQQYRPVKAFEVTYVRQ